MAPAPAPAAPPPVAVSPGVAPWDVRAHLEDSATLVTIRGDARAARGGGR